ncbi:MAG: DUF2845 domain-containing protein [Gammaproteobacteria bacterium]
MNIKWIIWPGAILLMLGASPALAWRCEHGLVDTGESAAAVRKKCGKPDLIYSDTGMYRRSAHKSTDERWYYNFGPGQLLRVLRFHGGVLQEIDTSGYGFKPSPGRCTPQDIRLGMSVYELLTRCGKPKSKRQRSSRSGGDKRGHAAGAITRTEIWTYDFGSQYLLQEVILSGGKVQSLETANRHAQRQKPHG